MFLCAVTLLWLPSLWGLVNGVEIETIGDNYEILITETDNQMNLKGFIEVRKTLKPEKSALLSKSFATTVNANKRVEAKAGYGEVGYFLMNHQQIREVGLGDGTHSALWDNESIFNIFLNDEAVSTEIISPLGDYKINGTAHLTGLRVKESKLDAIFDYRSLEEKNPEIIYISKYNQDQKKISEESIKRALSAVGLEQKSYNIVDYGKKKSEAAKKQEIIKFGIWISALLLLAIILKSIWQNRKDEKTFESWGLMFLTGVGLVVLAITAGRIDFTQLPLESVNENLVSLSYYIQSLKQAIIELFSMRNHFITYQGFRLEIFNLLQGSCYGAGFALTISALYLGKRDIQKSIFDIMGVLSVLYLCFIII